VGWGKPRLPIQFIRIFVVSHNKAILTTVVWLIVVACKSNTRKPRKKIMSSSLKEQIPFNPVMLRWAREWRGLSIEEVAKKIGKKPEDIFDWENNNRNPTVKQARSLSDLYGRPFLEFFLPRPPDIYAPKSVPDFRTHRGVDSPADNRLVRDIHRWAETQRINAIDLFAEIGESPAEVPRQILANLETPPDEAANSARIAIGFSFEDQVQLHQNEIDKLPEILRRKFEGVGILTLKRSDMRSVGVRGMCVAKFPLPVIAFTKESPAAQAYTLAHEFAHVLIKKSGITGQKSAEYASQPIEKWCDRFAASFLMPRTEIKNICGEKPNSPRAVIEDSELQRFADFFKVSQHALLIRLVHLGYVRASYYWDIKKPRFDEEENKFKTFGRAKYYGTRYKSSLGDLYTGLVLEAWGSGKITNHNAAEFMGIKKISHLIDIKNNFGRSK